MDKRRQIFHWSMLQMSALNVYFDFMFLVHVAMIISINL